MTAQDVGDAEDDVDTARGTAEGAVVVFHPNKYIDHDVLRCCIWIICKQVEIAGDERARPEHKQFRKLLHKVIQDKIEIVDRKRTAPQGGRIQRMAVKMHTDR